MTIPYLYTTLKRQNVLLKLALFPIIIIIFFLSACPNDVPLDNSDFRLVSGSGTVTVNLLDAYVTSGPPLTFYCGTTTTGTPLGAELEISSNDVSATIDSGGSGPLVFTGGGVLDIGGFIDVNGNGVTSHMADDGDYLASLKTITMSGDHVVTMSYPDDFTLVTGSGTVTIHIVNANGAHNGENVLFGTLSTGVPWGGELLITGDNVNGTIGDDVGGDLIFPGGIVLDVGCFIDLNNNGDTSHMADDGDYIASKSITVNGNMTVTLTYPDDFSLVTGSGTITINLLNGSSGGHSGKTFSCGTISAGYQIGEDITIDSDNVGETLNILSSNVVFTGSMSGVDVSGFIDVNGNGDTFHMADDGDYLANTVITMNGNQTVNFIY